MRFYGSGVKDIDRVKIPIDDPANNNPGPPADVGATDFTIEFWMRSPLTGNDASEIACGINYDWIYGNVIFDRDRYDQGRAFGISLANGRIAFGAKSDESVARTICGSTDVRDDAWHHVAVQRRLSDGNLWLYVDGTLEASGPGPSGDVSYPDDGIPKKLCSGPCTDSDPFVVIGAEKHDAGSAYPSFTGWVDEVRLSTTLRYPTSEPFSFTPASAEFIPDAGTAALYHFNEGVGDFIGDSAFGGLSPGERRFGRAPRGTDGPVWVADTPFDAVRLSGELELESTAQTADETAGSTTINVVRVGGSAGVASADYQTIDGSAVAGADYQVAIGTLSWSDGDMSQKSFVVTLVDDAEVEGDESFQATLTNVTGAVLGARDTTTVTLADDEMPSPPGSIGFDSSIAQASETSGAVTLMVSRSGGTAGSASVQYVTTNGSAVAGQDFMATSGTLQWADGQGGSQTISVPLIDDADVESDETFTIALQNLVGADAGVIQQAVVTINDDDTGPRRRPGSPLGQSR